jgi:hypothetical protein
LLHNIDRILASYILDKEERLQFIKNIIAQFKTRESLKIPLENGSYLLMSKTSRTLKNLRRFPNSPFPLLSNLESFSNTIGSINEELLSYGLQTRERLEDHPDN